MKENRSIIIDFDQRYREDPPGLNILVLSSEYENEWTLDVRKFKMNLSKNILDYSDSWGKLIEDVHVKYKDTLVANEAPFFDCVISPLSRWIEAIDYCYSLYNVESISFTSYSINQKIFFYEAEGESNTSFLYKKSYYLSFYLSLYLKNRYNVTTGFSKKLRTFIVTFNFYLRNFLLFVFILLKNFIFKCLVFKRVFLKRPVEPKILISSRAIVQSEFIKKYQDLNSSSSVLIVNEQSFRLFKHFKYLRKLDAEFIYAEGLLSFKDFVSTVRALLAKLVDVKKREIFFEYTGMRISSSAFLIEILLKEFDYIFYATSVKNAITRYLKTSKESKVISFEMFTSHSFYLKRILGRETYQVQTTLIEPKPSPNFICSDFFYFTNPITYSDFVETHLKLKDKLGCIPFLKYMGNVRVKDTKQEIKKMLYFTQPIDLEEERNILSFLDRYCVKNKIELIIKPHPRQLSEFGIYSKTALVVDKFVSTCDLIKSVDLVITRSSSLGLDAWIYGVPCIFAKLNKNIRNQNLFYAPNDYLGTVTSFKQFESVLDNYDKLRISFIDHDLYRKTDISNLSMLNIFIGKNAEKEMFF